ncbi:MAG: metallophosphoesterase [Gemmatimonadaceae bacterium]|nr:metallophosphoesterase [Chitinophagaceae bacterium]
MRRRAFLGGAGAIITAASMSPFDGVFAAPKKKTIRFAHITDIHVKAEKVAEAGMAAALARIAGERNKFDFVINTGDCIWDALAVDKEKTKAQWALYQKILAAQNKHEIHHAIGNHDVWGWFIKEKSGEDQDRLYGKQWAIDELKMPGRFYSFQKDLWHFMVLDSTQLNPAGGYIGQLDEDQFSWLSGELAKVPPAHHVCIVSHIPILSICAGLFFDKTEANGDLKIQRNLMHSDFFRIKKLFSQYPQVKVCISGHIHLQDEVDYLGVKYFCNGAVSGNWWKGKFQEFAPAYAAIELHENGTAIRTFINYES